MTVGAGVTTDVALLRLAAQRLVGPPLPTAVEAVRWLTAVQAQDYRGALTSVALRTASRALSDVEAALDAGEVVRSWPMRGTLHLVAAEDLGWMLELTTPRLIAGAAARRAGLELDDDTIERARSLALDALSGGRGLSRAGLLAVWQDAGVATTGSRGYHLIWHLAQTGTLCWGPVRGGEQVAVLLDEWVPQPRLLSRDEALGEWALRFFRSHGPATVKDFTRWTGLVAGDVRAGVALARPALASLEVDGAEHLMDPRTPEVLDAGRAAAAGVLLLPGFDEYMLGYGDRSAALPTEHADRIVPGGNGVFRPTVVSGGQVVGTWRHGGPPKRPEIEVEPFDAFTAQVTAALPAAYAGLP